MGKVSPPRVGTPRIVQPGAGGARWLWILVALGLGLWTWQVFEYGRQHAGVGLASQGRVEKRLRAQIDDLEKQRDALREAAVRFERAAQIDRAAADQVRAEVGVLQEQRAELQREVAFLKTLLSGDAPGGEELVLKSPVLTRLGDGVFRFEVKLSKRIASDVTVSGQATVKVSGSSDGKRKTLDMATLTDGKRTNIGLKFRNYQTLKAEFDLPEGFEPAAILVAVKPDGNDYTALQQSYDWQPGDA